MLTIAEAKAKYADLPDPPPRPDFCTTKYCGVIHPIRLYLVTTCFEEMWWSWLCDEHNKEFPEDEYALEEVQV